MPPASQAELLSLRDRLRSLERRVESFQRTVIFLLADLHSPKPRPPAAMLRTPQAIIQDLRDRYPDLANHPTLWLELRVLLLADRAQLNEVLQHDLGNAIAALRRHLEAVLHPSESE